MVRIAYIFLCRPIVFPMRSIFAHDAQFADYLSTLSPKFGTTDMVSTSLTSLLSVCQTSWAKMFHGPLHHCADDICPTHKNGIAVFLTHIDGATFCCQWPNHQLKRPHSSGWRLPPWVVTLASDSRAVPGHNVSNGPSCRSLRVTISAAYILRG